MAGLKLAGFLAVVWVGGFPLCTWVVGGRAPFQYPLQASAEQTFTTASPQTLLPPLPVSAEQYALVTCAFLSVLAAVREMEIAMAEVLGDTLQDPGRGHQTRSGKTAPAAIENELVKSVESEDAVSTSSLELTMAEVFDTLHDPGSMRERGRQIRSGKSDSRDHTHAALAAIKCSRKDELVRSVESEDVVSAKTGMSVSRRPPPPLEQAGDTAPPDAPSPVQAPATPSASATGVSPLELFGQWQKEKQTKKRDVEKRRRQWRLESKRIMSEMLVLQLESQMLVADAAEQQLACAAQSQTLPYEQENAGKNLFRPTRRNIHGKKL